MQTTGLPFCIAYAGELVRCSSLMMCVAQSGVQSAVLGKTRQRLLEEGNGFGSLTQVQQDLGQGRR